MEQSCTWRPCVNTGCVLSIAGVFTSIAMKNL
jgi:hypothetical protein